MAPRQRAAAILDCVRDGRLKLSSISYNDCHCSTAIRCRSPDEREEGTGSPVALVAIFEWRGRLPGMAS